MQSEVNQEENLNNEIYATRYMKSLFLFGRRWIGYFRLYLTGVRYFCMRSMDSFFLIHCTSILFHSSSITFSREECNFYSFYNWGQVISNQIPFLII